MDFRLRWKKLPNYSSVKSSLTEASDEDSKDDKSSSNIDEATGPEFVFSIEMSDLVIKTRIQHLPESQVAGTKNSEESTI
jgi:hypothetical protein